MTRMVHRSIALAVLATAGLTLALGIGLPDPRAAERAYGGVVGLLGCLLAMSWLRATAQGRAPDGRFSPGSAQEPDEPPQPPVVAAILDLERALRLGTSTIGSFNRLVQPRLRSLAEAKLSPSGFGLDDERAVGLLGDGFRLVDPSSPPPDDRMAPGVAFAEIERLVETLEHLGEN
jgi:hypothetical protein